MAVDAKLLQLFLELLTAYDPTISTLAGSPFRSKVLDPFLSRVGGSPLDVQLEPFLVDLLAENIPGIDVSTTSAIRDLVIRAFSVMSAPYRREINNIKISQSLNNYAAMSRIELDALMGNYFTSLNSGGKSAGTVRMYFPSPQSVVVSTTTQFKTGSGLVFSPDIISSISNTQMSFQQEGALYYFDVLVSAIAPGAAYNIPPGALSISTGISGVSRTTNKLQFRGGLDEETKSAGVARTRNSITTRNLITAPGVAFVIPQNFPSVDTLQVIGMGDAEMDRDIIYGPVTVSGIPGGLLGGSTASLSPGASVHIGGKTDIYVYQKLVDVDDLDIEDLTDKGVQVSTGSSGFTATGSPTGTFSNLSGFFVSTGVQQGDKLLVGVDEYSITTIVSESSLSVTPAMPGGLFGVQYEVVRRTTGLITIPLYDLTAVDSSGTPVLGPAGLPALPVPGSANNAALLDSAGAIVEKTHNRAAFNAKMPLLRASAVEVLDPLTLSASGQVLPMKDIVLSSTLDGLTLGGGGTASTGKVRMYFRDAVNCYVDSASTTFTSNGIAYTPYANIGQPTTGASGVVDHLVDEIAIQGDWTAAVAAGDRFSFLAGAAANIPFCILAVTYNAGSNLTILSVRETLADYLSASIPRNLPWEAFVGILEANMTSEPTSGLFYLDVAIVSPVLGAAADRLPGTQFTASNVYSEGWSLRTTYPDTSFSTKEKPYLTLTDWVSDTTNLSLALTAPAVRVSYDYAGSLSDIQTFVESPANRIVAQDVLVRHFVPAYVRAAMSVGGIGLVEAKALLVEYINALDPTTNLEVSDLISALDAIGATHVALPAYLVELLQDKSRAWGGTISQDRLNSSRIQHFIADAAYITLSTSA